ncbi:hypothetical protein TI03_02575 [Achromatium sp. WMS1]|nr:hypothetical protein TI03_02575 [Achromatium sp. WMS1]
MVKQQSGFTLIELMIVVAIIGILAAIALPQYQNFMARSQATESVVLLDGAKTVAEDFATFNGDFVAANDTAAGNTVLSGLGARVVGEYGVITTTVNNSNGAGTIMYKFNATGVNDNIKDKEVTYVRTQAGDWSCITTGANALGAAYLPKGCVQS